MRAVAVSAVAALIVAAGACTKMTPHPNQLGDQDGAPHVNPGGGGGGSGGALGDGGDGGTCVSIEPSGAVIAEQYVAENAPAPVGGAIVTGRYQLTKRFVYTGVNGQIGPTGNTFHEDFDIETSTFEDVLDMGSDGGAASLTGVSGKYMASSNTLVLSVTCPAPNGLQPAYSTLGNTLHLFLSATTEAVYTHL